MNTDTIHRDLKLSGPLTTPGANDIRGLISEALETSDSVRIDVSEVTDIDLSFLQTLIAAHKTAKLERKSLTVLASGSEALAVQIFRCGLPASVLPDFRDVFPLVAHRIPTMKTILALDDSPSVRQMVKLTLTSAGYAVVEAGDGVEGLAKAKTNACQMVVTDLNMPNMNGLAFIRELRLLPAYQGIPIVFLTTESDDALKQEAKAAGATGWITKPFKPEQLTAVAKKLLG